MEIIIDNAKIVNNPAINKFHSLMVKEPFLINEIMPVISAKKNTNTALSNSV